MNTGAWPVDPDTEIGWLRLSIGDADGTPHVPADGYADFVRFSDDALQTVIDLYPDNKPMQIGTAYQRIGMALAASGQRVRVDDIEIDTRDQAKTYFELARQWFDIAESSGSSDAFQIVPTGAQPYSRPEGTPYPQIG